MPHIRQHGSGDHSPKVSAVAATRVLVVLASANRRGAEHEGWQLAGQLAESGLAARTVALAAGQGSVLPVEVLGNPRSPSTLWKLRRLARTVDVVLAYGSTTLPACALALLATDTPFVYRSIGDPRSWVRGGLHRTRTRWLMGRSRRIVALWSGSADAVADLYGIPAHRIDVIPNARSAEDFGPEHLSTVATARAALEIPADATVVALIGALSAEKRPLLAVDIVAGLPGVWLVIAGDGPMRADVAAACTEHLPERSRQLGSVADVRPLLVASDVVLICSSTEGMPGVAIEASMTGRRVVASTVGAVSEMFAAGVRGQSLAVDATLDEWRAAIAAQTSLPNPDPLHTYSWKRVLPAWLELIAERMTRSKGQ